MSDERPASNMLMGFFGLIVLAGVIYIGYAQLSRDGAELQQRADAAGVESMAELAQLDLADLNEDVDTATLEEAAAATAGETGAEEDGEEAEEEEEDTEPVVLTANLADAPADEETTEEEVAEAEAEAAEADSASANTPEDSQSSTDEPAAAPAQEAANDEESTADASSAAADEEPTDAVAAFNKGGCAGCHVIPGVPGANGQIGPDLTRIGVDAATRIDGYTGDEYIRESIVEPNAFIASECPTGACPENVMLQAFGQVLAPQDLTSIVGYLSVLGTDEALAMSDAAAAPVVLDAGLPPESVLEPFMDLPNDPASDAQIALGKYLFFDSRLSGNNSLSCASCHMPQNGFTDGEALSRGYPSTSYFRNTPTVYNTVFNDYLYRDGRMDGGDMSTMVRDHIAEAHFMSMDGRLMVERINQVPAYVDLYNEVYGSGPGYGSTLNALKAYVQSLNSPAGPYDAYLAGDESALSDDAAAGAALFEASCSGCHSDALLSDNDFHNTGVATDLAMFEDPERHLTFRRFFRILGTPNYRNLNEDVGLYALTLEEEDLGKFRTPSLREVASTAPYMHNGSLATLDEVVRFYNDGGGEGQSAGLESLGLNDAEIGQLVAFLESLSSDLPPVEAPVLPNYDLLPLGDGQMAEEQTDDAFAEEATTEEAEPEEATEAEPAAVGAAASEMVVSAFTKGTCTACHMLPGVEAAIGQLGPSLAGIGTTAAERIDGYTAEEYIRESIIEPEAYLVEECPLGPCTAGLMQPTFAQLMSDEEYEALVANLGAAISF